MWGIISIKRIFLTALLLAALLPQDGWACLVVPMSEEELKNAYFIGVIKIIDRKMEERVPEELKEGVLPKPLDYIYTIQPIYSYKNQKKDIFQVHMSSAVCGSYKSDLIETAIFEHNGSLYLNFPYKFSKVQNVFEKYRNEAPKSDAFLEIEKACSDEGKRLHYELQGIFCKE